MIVTSSKATEKYKFELKTNISELRIEKGCTVVPNILSNRNKKKNREVHVISKSGNKTKTKIK